MPKVIVISDCRGLGGNLVRGQILDLDYGQDASGQPIGKDAREAGELNHAGRICELDNPKMSEDVKALIAKSSAKPAASK